MKTCLPILLSCWLFPALGIAQRQAADLLRHYRQILPFEKLYLHTDQSVYEPGDLIWFRAHLTDDNNRPSGAGNRWIQAQLLDPQGQVIQTLNLSHLSGSLRLNTNAEGGVYTLRAATQWLFNFGPDLFYEKKILVQKTVLPRLRLKLELDRSKYQPGERVIAQLEALSNNNQAIKNIDIKATPILGSTSLEPISVQTDQEGKATIVFQLPTQLPNVDGLLQVKLLYEGQNESIARSIPIEQEQVKLGIFPEGGDLVAGFQQKVAFKMMDTLGNPIDGQGTLFNDKHQALLSFESYHKGMGHFSFSPRLGERYYLKIDGQKDSFPLPDPRQDELALRVGLADQDSLPLKIWKRNPGQAQLVLRSKDSIVWQQKLFFQAGESSLKLPVAKLPIGIAQVLVLDEAERPYAERLVFLNRHRQAQLRISTAKKEYLPLDDIEINIEAHDEMGKPLDGVFSLAVVNDLHWTMADDKQDNILSRLLLSAELKGKIDEPAFYFKPDEPKVPEALDLLMLTHGWRKFSWKDLITISPESIVRLVKYPQGNVLSGQLLIYRNRTKSTKGKIWIKGNQQRFDTDPYGKFQIPSPPFGFDYPITLMAKSKTYRATQIVSKPLFAEIKWPSAVKTSFKPLNIDKIGNPEIKQTLDVIPNDNLGLELSGMVSGLALNEMVVTGFGYAKQRSASLAMVSGDSDVAAGIGDNLALNRGYFSYDAPLAIYLNNRPDYYWYNDEYQKNIYDRVFATFPQSQGTNYQPERAKTVYWAPELNLTRGKGRVKYQHTAQTGTFRIVLEGVAQQAVVGRAEQSYAVQKQVELIAQAPGMVLSGDTLVLQVKIRNRLPEEVRGEFNLSFSSDGFTAIQSGQKRQSLNIPRDSFVLLNIPLLVHRRQGEYPLNLVWASEKAVETWSQNIQVQVQGFNHEVAQSGQYQRVVFQLPLSDAITGSPEARFNAYTTIYQEMVEGLEAIVREPHGCFEQVSSSNYPSIMALQLLNEMGGIDFAFQKKALAHLNKGYKLLTGYEVPGGGFSIFGKVPANERLTAYGLLQFWDMRSVYPEVSMTMFEKNLNWLLDRKKVHRGVYSTDVLSHLFTLYALSEIRPELLQEDLAKFEQSHQQAIADDPYLLAILLCAQANLKSDENTERLQQQLIQLLQVQSPGNFKVDNTFSLSYGKNVQTETAAWVILALCKAGQAKRPELHLLLDFLRSSRDYAGGFGSTQATVIALKALQAFQKANKQQLEDGKIRVRVNEVWLDTLYYQAMQRHKLQVDLKPWLKPGLNEIEVEQISAAQSIPFLLEANWTSPNIPKAAQHEVLEIKTQYSKNNPVQGEFVRLNVSLSNKLSRPVNAPMAIIGIPAGLSLQSWQLLEMEKNHLFDHFELKDNYLVVYFESLEAGKERNFHLDLKADQIGSYQSPFSVAYPYYDADQKYWAPSTILHIGSSSN